MNTYRNNNIHEDILTCSIIPFMTAHTTLVDSGATISTIGLDLVLNYGLSIQKPSCYRYLKLANGQFIKRIGTVKIEVEIDSYEIDTNGEKPIHYEGEVQFEVINNRQDFIIGLDMLRKLFPNNRLLKFCMKPTYNMGPCKPSNKNTYPQHLNLQRNQSIYSISLSHGEDTIPMYTKAGLISNVSLEDQIIEDYPNLLESEIDKSHDHLTISFDNSSENNNNNRIVQVNKSSNKDNKLPSSSKADESYDSFIPYHAYSHFREAVKTSSYKQQSNVSKMMKSLINTVNDIVTKHYNNINKSIPTDKTVKLTNSVNNMLEERIQSTTLILDDDVWEELLINLQQFVSVETLYKEVESILVDNFDVIKSIVNNKNQIHSRNYILQLLKDLLSTLRILKVNIKHSEKIRQICQDNINQVKEIIEAIEIEKHFNSQVDLLNDALHQIHDVLRNILDTECECNEDNLDYLSQSAGFKIPICSSLKTPEDHQRAIQQIVLSSGESLKFNSSKDEMSSSSDSSSSFTPYSPNRLSNPSSQ